ncbi:MAG: hypothetical protein KDA96_27130 [Planctomycetaceae bacterium]|nr:hypothetical protein [Planctomycetaceae bacterium]
MSSNRLSQNRLNQNRLRLYCPPEETNEAALRVAEADSDCDVIPFESGRRTVVISGRFTPALDRARILHNNRQCPECGACDVEPLELADSLINPHNRLPVPGTATLVGFHCNQCQLEWPVYEITRRNG